MRKRFLLLAALLGPAVTPSVHALNDVYEIWYITHNEAKDVYTIEIQFPEKYDTTDKESLHIELSKYPDLTFIEKAYKVEQDRHHYFTLYLDP